MSDISFDQIKNNLLGEINRYQINLEVVLAIKSLIEEKYPEINVLSPERKIIIDDKDYKKAPDLIIHNVEMNCVINENKTSIAPDENNLSKISTQLSDYMKISAILDENGSQIRINDFTVNLLVNIESYDDCKDYFLDNFSNNNKFSIMTFSLLESVRRDGIRFYLFELRDNSTVIEEFNELFTSRPKKFLIDFQREGEEIYFITDPPVQYTIVIIWIYILPLIIDENGYFNMLDIENTIRKYYGKWDTSRVYFKKAWLKEALQNLCEMEWVKDNFTGTYQLVKTLDLSGDVQDIVCSKLAKLIFESIVEELEEKKRDKSVQVNLFRFVKNGSS